MRTSKTGRWQTATILGLADTFLMAGWQSQLQVIARNLLEISIKVGHKSFHFSKQFHRPEWYLAKTNSEAWVCVWASFESHSPQCNGKTMNQTVHFSTFIEPVFMVLRRIQKRVENSLCLQVVYSLAGLHEAIHSSRLSWSLSILHVVHTQLHKMASPELFYEERSGQWGTYLCQVLRQ